MASYNRVIIMGNLTRDPEYRQLSSGQAVCRLGLASNRQFKNRQTGQVTQEVCFVDIDVWGAQAESCNQYLQKGRQVLVEGRLKQDTWEDNDGQKRSKHTIVADRVTFLSSASDLASSSEESDLSETRADLDSEPKAPTRKQSVSPAKVAGSRDKEESSSQSGEVNFKDEKPFEDDLPF